MSIEPLAPFGQNGMSMTTNLSRSMSLSLLDSNGTELKIRTTRNDPFVLFIPHDRTFVIPPMFIQNVTTLSSSSSPVWFHSHFIRLNRQLNQSVHFEIQPMNENVSYVFLYRFDHSSLMIDGSRQLIDGYTYLCASGQIFLFNVAECSRREMFDCRSTK